MAFPAENDASPTITVQIYNYSLASPTMLVGAEREAGRILRMAGLRAVWLECPVGPFTPAHKDIARKRPKPPTLGYGYLVRPSQISSRTPSSVSPSIRFSPACITNMQRVAPRVTMLISRLQ